MTATIDNDDANETDPYLWLEEVTGDRALSWVGERNSATIAELASGDEFDAMRADLLAILDSDQKIPHVAKRSELFYNFWQDERNPRGIWRRTTLEQYRTAEPEWEILLDVDALNSTEEENWVWHGVETLRPDHRHGLISLSRGGADANVTREFDLSTLNWVDDGFVRPEAKGGLTWIDEDTVYVTTDFGEGSMTASGYPRLVKKWRRGTPMSDAELVFEGKHEDMYVSAWHDHTPGFTRDFVVRALAFYRDELYLCGPDGELTKVDAPNSAEKNVHREWLFLQLRENYSVNDAEWQAGSLLVIRFDDFLAGDRDFTALFTPTETTSLAGYHPTLHHVLITTLDNVSNRVFVASPDGPTWTVRPLEGAPELGTVDVWAVDDEAGDEYFMETSDFLAPSALYMGEIGGVPVELKRLPAFFDANGLSARQYFATSPDGTAVPYFLIGPEDLEPNGTHPTLLYGYGGFEISLTPGYSGDVGRGWLAGGGVYVVANIRGGGEYGPRWHQAALRENRRKAYEDFAAVAEDLVRRGVTSPAHLGIEGGSNGGLLMGNMLTTYPDLFGAVVCEVPLLDMRRYHQLLAGASWMAEYGDPDDPDDWRFLRDYSAYHNVRKDRTYPPILLTTSTRDDRVHPGHARKMMARLTEYGHAALYYENLEGGHGRAADNPQRAFMRALGYTFLARQLAEKQ